MDGKFVIGMGRMDQVFGAFFDKAKEADSIFNFVAEQYESVKEGFGCSVKPKVLTGSNFRGTWHAGENFMAQLYHDAGADYLYIDDNSKAVYHPWKLF